MTVYFLLSMNGQSFFGFFIALDRFVKNSGYATDEVDVLICPNYYVINLNFKH